MRSTWLLASLLLVAGCPEPAPVGGVDMGCSANVQPGCVTRALADPMQPSCVVEDVTAHNDGTQTTVEIPRCTANVFPCWRISMKTSCQPASPQGLELTVDRNGQPPPANTTAVASCAINC